MIVQQSSQENIITDDLDALLAAIPRHFAAPLREKEDLGSLLEIVMDLGRIPAARFRDREVALSDQEVTQADLDYVTERVGDFGLDNRAGIERTLHRISAIRNRKGKVIGLTCRVGRAVFGTIRILEDLVGTGKSLLLLGRPGVGKTTMLREVARVLAEDFSKRVVVVDTSNEIAGDGDIPHAGIGRARRMQVPTPALQHEVMIEAVENHMPEVIIIDEIGRELETQAARTIAERGVQLVATAHGNTLENLVNNPTLADLVGGIQSVTLGDEEARRRGTQKSILERKAPPTFDVVVEIQSWIHVTVHADVATTIDSFLRGYMIPPEERLIDEHGQLRRMVRPTAPRVGTAPPAVGRAAGPRPRGESPDAGRVPQGRPPEGSEGKRMRVYLFGVNRGRADQVIRSERLPVELVDSINGADAVITTKAHYRNRPSTLMAAEAASIPVYVLRKNTGVQIEQSLLNIAESSGGFARPAQDALHETEAAVERLESGGEHTVELSPQSSYVRRLQHEIATKHNLESRSAGKEPLRRVRLYRGR